MSHNTSKVNTILVELTDITGYSDLDPKHLDAFRTAERKLVELIAELQKDCTCDKELSSINLTM